MQLLKLTLWQWCKVAFFWFLIAFATVSICGPVLGAVVLGVIFALCALGAFIWTVVQTDNYRSECRRAVEQGCASPLPLYPAFQRFLSHLRFILMIIPELLFSLP